MQPADLDQKIEKARQLGVPDHVIMERVKQKYPDYHKKTLLDTLLGKAMGVAKDIGAGIGMHVAGKGYQQSQDAALDASNRLAARAQTATDPEERRRLLSVAQSTNATVAHNADSIRGSYSPDVNVNPAIRGIEAAGEIGTLIEAPGAIKAGAKLAGKAGGVVAKIANPKRLVGQAIERKAARAGNIGSQALEKEFGTVDAPNPKLYEGLSTASGKQELLDKVRQEITTQGRSGGGGIAEPSFSDILNYRKGAYTAAKYAKGTPQTAEQKLYANIGRAYDAILKEGAHTGRLDKSYAMLSKIQGIAKPTKNILKYTIMYKAAEALLNKALPKN